MEKELSDQSPRAHEVPVAAKSQRERSSAVSADSDPNASGVSNRKIRKREFDRRAQKAARERTKARIAYLENIVEAAQEQDGDSRISALTTRVAHLQKKNDELAGILRHIVTLAGNQSLPKDCSRYEQVWSGESRDAGEAVQPTQEFSPSSNLHVPPVITSNNGGPQTSHPLVEDGTFPLLPTGHSITMQYFDAENVTMNPAKSTSHYNNIDMCNLAVNDSSAGYGAFDERPSPIGSLSGLVNVEDISPMRSLLDLNTINNLTIAPIVSGNISANSTSMLHWDASSSWGLLGQQCECSSRSNHPRQKPQRNRWRLANDTLVSTRTNHMREMVIGEGRGSNDSPAIQAILEGWDAIPDLDPSWQALRTIDQEIFASCGDVERLAILHIMHLLLQYHADSTPERFSRLPSWYTKRPSEEAVAHAYAVNYFAWPGLRERFVFGEHHYCSNIFWDLFCSSFRLLWPYEFRDCYVRDMRTGQYEISPTFSKWVLDLNCWAMGPDIFKQYPEFRSDMVSIDMIPANVPRSRALISHQEAGEEERHNWSVDILEVC